MRKIPESYPERYSEDLNRLLMQYEEKGSISVVCADKLHAELVDLFQSRLDDALNKPTRAGYDEASSNPSCH